nr:MAG TPA: hypothetical protein [Caudoviricetes sp.]
MGLYYYSMNPMICLNIHGSFSIRCFRLLHICCVYS